MIRCILAAFATAALSLHAEPLDVWVRISTFTNGINRVWADGGLVFASTKAGVFTSTNASSWPAAPILPSGFMDIAYGNGVFCAVGNQNLATSTDGQNWTLRTLGTTASLRSVAFGNGTFVAVGDSSMAWLSDNGANWRAVPAAQLPSNAYRIVFQNGTFRTVGGGGQIASSVDGSTWTREPISATVPLWDVAFGNGLWVAVGGTGTILHWRGGPWLNNSTRFATNTYLGLAFAGNSFVMVGDGTLIWTSSDGANWVGRNALGNLRLASACFANGRFLVGGPDGLFTSDPLPVPPDRTPLTLAGRLYPGMVVNGWPGYKYRIEAAPSLDPGATWISVGTLTLKDANGVWIDLNGAAAAASFYRAVLDPIQ